MRLTKLSSFTLTELLVGLAIASLVVTMGYMVLNLFGKNIVSISGNYDNNANVRLLEQQLWTDFNRFPKATANTKLEELTFKSSIDSVV